MTEPEPIQVEPHPPTHPPRQSWANIGRFGTKFGQIRARFGQSRIWPNSGQIWASSAQIGPRLAEPGQWCWIPGRFGRTHGKSWPNLAGIGPILGRVSWRLAEVGEKLGRTRPPFGPKRARFVEVVPKLGTFGLIGRMSTALDRVRRRVVQMRPGAADL